MRQVLFYIPVKEISDSLPEAPLLVYLALAIAIYGLCVWFDRRRRETHADSKWQFKTLGILVVVLLAIRAIFQVIADSAQPTDPSPAIPIYGYGTMLFVAFVACIWLAGHLAEKERIATRNQIQDLGIWVFLFGLIGARLCFMFLASPEQFTWDWSILWQFFRVWDGGLVFYGSALGGVVGYFVAYFLFLRKNNVSTWQMADIIAPCAALGLCLGRIGCLLNGCCYGNVACADCPGVVCVCRDGPAITFPLASPPRTAMVGRGHQTAAGFTLVEPKTPAEAKSTRVAAVEPNSPAATIAKLQPNDVIVKVNTVVVETRGFLFELFSPSVWAERFRGRNDVQLTVNRDGKDITLAAFSPRTIGLHPTQIYESISMTLLFLLLLAYLPIRKHDGAVMVLFMLGYGVHRFLNEILRTDTDVKAFDMTLSQNLSLVTVLAGLALMAWVLKRPARQPGTA